MTKKFDITTNLRLISPNEIFPYEGNAKNHPQEQVEVLANIIDRDGFDQPIVVDKNSVIIRGHARRLAALHLGLEKVPVLVRDDLSPKQVKAARLSDNQVALLGDMDMTALNKEIAEMMAMEGDIDISVQDMGFDPGDLELDMPPIDETFIPPNDSGNRQNSSESNHQDEDQAPERDLSQPDLSKEQVFKNLMQVIVDCPTEADQEIIYNMMTEKGYVARVLTI